MKKIFTFSLYLSLFLTLAVVGCNKKQAAVAPAAPAEQAAPAQNQAQ